MMFPLFGSQCDHHRNPKSGSLEAPPGRRDSAQRHLRWDSVRHFGGGPCPRRTEPPQHADLRAALAAGRPDVALVVVFAILKMVERGFIRGRREDLAFDTNLVGEYDQGWSGSGSPSDGGRVRVRRVLGKCVPLLLPRSTTVRRRRSGPIPQVLVDENGSIFSDRFQARSAARAPAGSASPALLCTFLPYFLCLVEVYSDRWWYVTGSRHFSIPSVRSRWPP